MNDSELNEMLEKWTVPDVPPSLRMKVRAGFAARAERRAISTPRFGFGFRKSVLGAALAGAAAVLLVVAQAFPQMLRMGSPVVRAPYTVDSEFISYDAKGVPAENILTTSYNQNGREVILSKGFTGDPWRTARWQILSTFYALHTKLITPFVVSPEQLERVNRLPRLTIGDAGFILPKSAAAPAAGCVDDAVVGRESILQYPTAAIRLPNLPGEQRVIVWMAPQLGCFALKATVEERRPDGSFRLIGRKQALSVKINPVKIKP